MKKKSIFIIIDALRHDLLHNKSVRKKLFPTINSILSRGFITKAVANAQSTQFVLPSLFSSSYPLDHGGYNFGIRHRVSYIEQLKKNKFKTYIVSTCNQMGIGNGYDRAVDKVFTTNDYRLIIEQKINRTLLYEIDLLKKNKKTKKQVIKVLKKELGITLDRIISYKNIDQALWPKKLSNINTKVITGCINEKKILIENPEIILNKMKRVSGGIYWHTLGKVKYNSFSFQYKRLIGAISWRFKKIIAKQNFWPFLRYGHCVVVINDIIDVLVKKILSLEEKKWHVHMHFMDVHDCRSINNPIVLLKRLRFFPKWLLEKTRGNIKHRFLYVSAMMDVDRNLGKLFKALEKKSILKDILILITADHASSYAESPRGHLDVEKRTHYEDLDVPFIMSNISKKPKKNTICDSMDITTTFLSALKIVPDSSSKGQNIFKQEKTFAISESCGSGNADIERRDIFFTVTTKKFKMMATLSNKELKAQKLFNLLDDPYEKKNIIENAMHKKDINFLFEILYKNRKEIFDIKGIKKPKFKFKPISN
ncbi:MAG: hypothetical protein CMJ41_00825 [Phycisphaerae bacterium]|nr:hypothetical protein [Phycisphaerae bacterium]